MGKWACILAGSAAGGAARVALAEAVHRCVQSRFPLGTTAVNLSGCLLVGALNALAEERMRLGPEARALLVAGFCGGYTTFSSWILETSALLKSGHAPQALANLALSVLLGLALFRLGESLVRALG